MKMKKLQIALLFLLTGLTSCYEDYIEDYETTSAGFAISNPLRTVISDRNMSIYVGVSLGGKREVDKADWAKFTIDESLLNGTGFTFCRVTITRWATRKHSGYANPLYLLQM